MVTQVIRREDKLDCPRAWDKSFYYLPYLSKSKHMPYPTFSFAINPEYLIFLLLLLPYAP